MITRTFTAVDTYFFLCNPDWTFALEEGEISTNQELCSYLETTLSKGEYAYLSWSCANTKKIQVGDRAYLVRSNSTPTGIIASGVVVEGFEDEQLRNLGSQYADLSAAYVDYYDNKYYVRLQIDTVVDFDFPLEQHTLKQRSEFQGVNFQFLGSGKQFAPGNPIALEALAKAWRSHSMERQAEDKGCRLIDVFLEMGDTAREEKDFEKALWFYQQALDIDSTYSKAQNKLKICQSIINKARPSTIIVTPPSTFFNELGSIRDELDQEEPLVFSDVNEARKRVLIEIIRRQGQTRFRQILLTAYGYKCAITGFDAEAALEAAHIIPYVETENNDPRNGILLRADLHTLFDLNLFVIHPDTMQVLLCPLLQETEYRLIHEKKVNTPAEVGLRPDPSFLKRRLEQCTWLNKK